MGEAGPMTDCTVFSYVADIPFRKIPTKLFEMGGTEDAAASRRRRRRRGTSSESGLASSRLHWVSLLPL